MDETGIEDFHINFGRNHSGIPVPQLTQKTPGQKCSVLGVVGFHGVVHAIPFDDNYTSEMFEHAIRHIVLPSLPRDSYVMMDNANIHNGCGYTCIFPRCMLPITVFKKLTFDS